MENRMEIERKYLVAARPDLDGVERYEIEQGYLALDDEGGTEVRLRRKGDELLLTVKGGSGESRLEEEIELDGGRFEALWPLTERRRVVKTRHLIAHGPHTIELDVYAGQLEGLLVAEVEFPDQPSAEEFEPPDWFGDEVTGDRRYLNQTLATEGAPG
jgi:CYTH domain-containing protein